MSALGGAAAGGEGINPTGTLVGIVILLVSIAATYALGFSIIPLIGIIIGGALVGFGVHFVPVGGAPAAMGQAPGIATGVAMLAAGAGLAGLFGGAWAFEATGDFAIAVAGGAVGGGIMMSITCMMVNATYVFAMGIPAASGKVAKDPITGDTFPEYKSQGTEGHGLPFISFFGGVIGGIVTGLGGTLIYLALLGIYETGLPVIMRLKQLQSSHWPYHLPVSLLSGFSWSTRCWLHITSPELSRDRMIQSSSVFHGLLLVVQ